MSNQLSHNYALLIGVGKSAYPEWSLPVTVKDIQALKSFLTNSNLCGYIDDNDHLRLLHDQGATSQAILDGLDWLKQQAQNDSEATVLIYYSGHGWLDKSSEKYYLIPHDIKPHKISKSALPSEKFNEVLRQIQAKRLLIIIDSCHAQGMATSKDEPIEIEIPDNFLQTALTKNLIKDLKQGTGRVVFTSSTGRQLSWVRPDNKMSIYTYHFLEALQGAGNQPGDKVVRVSDLMNYLGKTVSQSAQQLCHAEQTPIFDFLTEDFTVALLCGGKGLPTKGSEEIEAEIAETIKRVVAGKDIISSSGDQIVEQFGSHNINIGNIGKARDINLGSKT